MTLVAFSPSRGSLLNGIYPGDKTSDQIESRLQIEIHVDDMNDNEPFFDKASYNITVPEDTLPGTAIFQVGFIFKASFSSQFSWRGRM